MNEATKPAPSAVELVDELVSRRETIRTVMGGEAKVARLRGAGEASARDWIDALLDRGSFREIGTFVRADVPEDRASTPGDGVIAGHGLLDGRPITVKAYDVTVKGGSNSNYGLAKGRRVIKQAKQFGNPIVLFGQAGGGRVQSLLGSELFAVNAKNLMGDLPRLVPKVTAIVGRSYGSSSFAAAESDFVVQLRGTVMAVTSPRVIEVATGETVDEEELGGVAVHESKTGQIDLAVDTPSEVTAAIGRFLSFLPSNAKSLPPRKPARTPELVPELRSLVPSERRRAYDMRKVIAKIVDDGEFMEIKPKFGRSLLTGLARIDGWSVGIIASQPMQQGGVLTPDTLDKEMSFVALCDSYHIPLVFLVDTPGLLVGKTVEHARVLHKAIALSQCLSLVGVPVMTVILRKAYGLAYQALGGGHPNAASLAVWPTAEISFMDPEVGVNVVHGSRLEALSPTARREETEQLVGELGRATTAYDAAISMGVDEIIDPAETPLLLSETLARAMNNYDVARFRALAYWPTGLG